MKIRKCINGNFFTAIAVQTNRNVKNEHNKRRRYTTEIWKIWFEEWFTITNSFPNNHRFYDPSVLVLDLS